MRASFPRALKIPDFSHLFSRIENAKLPPQFWLVVVWLLLVLPTISLRGAHYEEGTVLGLARGALVDGHWLQPHLYGVRFVERPVLLSWLLAAFSLPFGRVDLWLARVVIAALYLAAGWVIFSFVRRHATPLAALFAALCFFVCPMLLQKVTTAEPDLLLALLMFIAFVIWWDGEREGKVGIGRAVAVGLVLAAAGLVKGPQPLAYFFLGIGAYLLFRRWAGLFTLAFIGLISIAVVGAWYFAVLQPGDASLWAGHSRLGGSGSLGKYILGALQFSVTLLAELLPGVLLAVPLAIAAWRKTDSRRNDLVLALALYALCCSLVLIFWPGARGRYAMPAALPIAALAGLAFDRLRAEKPALVNASVAILCLLAVYKMALNWVVMPLAPSLFDSARAEGGQIAAAIARNPAPLKVARGIRDLNALIYVDVPTRIIRNISGAAQPPVWMIVTAAQEQKLRDERPELRIVPHLALKRYKAQLIEVGAK
jgi:4-amino-4-deoxy-L-arabinose transferase-like glycosyltransferase